MIYFAQCAQNQADLVAKEAEEAGASEVKITASGVQFIADQEAAYRFCLTSRIATRVLEAIFFDDNITSTDDLYASALDSPWQKYISPDKTFSLSQSVKNCPWLNSAHFATLKIKDAIVDKIRAEFNDERPNVDTENPDVGFHIHLKGNRVIVYLDFSGPSLFKRDYMSQTIEANLKEHLAAAVIYRSEWYKDIKNGKNTTLLDPFCGLGTIAIEAALIAYDIAPGLCRKSPYAFEKLSSFNQEVYDKVLDELAEKAEASKDKQIIIRSSDVSHMAVESAKAAALKAGVYDYIGFEVKDFKDYTAEDIPSEIGAIITDPPYGIRMTSYNVEDLYSSLGEIMQELFKGWKISILCGDSSLLSNIDLKPERTNKLFNGPIECQLAHYSIYTAEEKEELIKKAIKRREERLAQPLSEGANMAYNRLMKNIKDVKPKMEAKGITCYRIYDADMPEYSAAIDVYENKWINLQEYAPPLTIDKDAAEKRLQELIYATERATGIDLDNIFVKQRKEQKGKDQYNKLASKNKFFVVKENGCNVLVNFTDYLDTGIFLDHRPIRKYIQENSKDRRFLNLFCYTATASLNALKGGALSTTNVDASSTYLDWAVQNFSVNGYPTNIGNGFYKSDVIDYLWDTYDKFDLIFCDPPTFSNKKGRESFDVQRDQVDLINAAMMHLEKDGTLIFSNNFRKFKLSEYLEDKYSIEEISHDTIDEDFQRDMKIHKCYLIKHKVKVSAKKKITLKAE